MTTRVLLFLAAAFGLSSALGTTSCGPTCPANEPNCGTANGSTAGAAGAAGAESTASCDQLTALKSCMNAFCARAPVTNPFCKCYKLNFDLSFSSCSCVDFNAKNFCEKATGVTYDCSSATGSVGSACIGVE